LVLTSEERIGVASVVWLSAAKVKPQLLNDDFTLSWRHDPSRGREKAVTA
jgi:hypothetical protein